MPSGTRLVREAAAPTADLNLDVSLLPLPYAANMIPQAAGHSLVAFLHAYVRLNRSAIVEANSCTAERRDKMYCRNSYDALCVGSGYVRIEFGATGMYFEFKEIDDLLDL